MIFYCLFHSLLVLKMLCCYYLLEYFRSYTHEWVVFRMSFTLSCLIDLLLQLLFQICRSTLPCLARHSFWPEFVLEERSIFLVRWCFQDQAAFFHSIFHIQYSWILQNFTLAGFFFLSSKARRSAAQSRQRSWLHANISISSGSLWHLMQRWG